MRRPPLANMCLFRSRQSPSRAPPPASSAVPRRRPAQPARAPLPSRLRAAWPCRPAPSSLLPCSPLSLSKPSPSSHTRHTTSFTRVSPAEPHPSHPQHTFTRIQPISSLAHTYTLLVSPTLTHLPRHLLPFMYAHPVCTAAVLPPIYLIPKRVEP